MLIPILTIVVSKYASIILSTKVENCKCEIASPSAYSKVLSRKYGTEQVITVHYCDDRQTVLKRLIPRLLDEGWTEKEVLKIKPALLKV